MIYLEAVFSGEAEESCFGSQIPLLSLHRGLSIITVIIDVLYNGEMDLRKVLALNAKVV
jgi:hypothetical protein